MLCNLHVAGDNPNICAGVGDEEILSAVQPNGDVGVRPLYGCVDGQWVNAGNQEMAIVPIAA
jgi:hypothetical protein